MTTLHERKSKSFDVVLGIIKLLITLSTAIIGYLVSLILSEYSNVMNNHTSGITWSLIFFGGCVLFAILTILKITGILGNEAVIPNEEVSIYDTAVRIFFSICLVSFLIGIVILGSVSLNELYKARVIPRQQEKKEEHLLLFIAGISITNAQYIWGKLTTEKGQTPVRMANVI